MNSEKLKKNCKTWLVHGGSIFTMLEEPFIVSSKKLFGLSNTIITTTAERTINSLDFVGFSIVEEFGSSVGRDKESLEEYINEVSVKEISQDTIYNSVNLMLGNPAVLEELGGGNESSYFQLFDPQKADAWFYIVNRKQQHCIFLEREEYRH